MSLTGTVPEKFDFTEEGLNVEDTGEIRKKKRVRNDAGEFSWVPEGLNRYKNFVMNYNMQNMNKELPELFSMLKSAEVEIRKENQVLMVNKTTSFKKQGKPNKGKIKKGGKKVAAPPEKPKAGPKPDTVCYYCKEKGHWKRNCPKYLADLKSGLIKKKGISDIHVIDVYLTVSWMSSKQCTVVKSSTESEYIAASEASPEAVWMKRFIVEFGVVPSALDPLVIYCDNMGAIANAQEPRWNMEWSSNVVRSLGWDPDITRSSGMVRRIRFIYRKSLSKFGNDPVHLWKALECSRTFSKKSPWKVESRMDSTNPNQPTKRKVESMVDFHHLGRPRKKGKGESHSP
ncbi:hypothetical protein QYE76_015153 [Lolium multiflorum]|uniref:CCHC-type domain-containing protein n=1 Tax=Lolium multiflorum TaxID=4521 RepID=A0AAD8U3V4_LOLMU|nr:hypothetical protein QYE76_015153 [Lolium multiflorum]